MPSLAVKDLRTGRKEIKIIGLMKTGTNANLLPTAIPPVLQLSKLIPDAAPERIALSTLADDKITKWTRDEIGRKEMFSKQDFHLNSPTVIKVSETPVFNGDGLGTLIDTQPNDTDSKITVTNVAQELSTVVVSGVETVLFDVRRPLSFVMYNTSAKHIIMDNSGKIHIAFSDSHVDGVMHAYYACSSDGGKTFSVERVDTTDSNDQLYEDIVIDNSGIVHFVYVQGGAKDSAIGVKLHYRRKYLDGTWSAVIRLDVKDNYFKYDPVIQVKNDGVTVGVAWVSGGYGSNRSNMNLIYREINSDLSLGTTNVITTTASNTKEYRCPTLDYNINGYPHIGCFSKPYPAADTPRNVWYFTYNGSAWDSGTQVSDVADYGSYHSNIVIDNKNRTHMLYCSGTSYEDVKYRRRVNGSWETPITITLADSSAVDALAIQISVLSNGSINAFYSRYIDAADKVIEYITINPDGTFEDQISLYNVDGYSGIQPQIIWSKWPMIASKELSTPQLGNIIAQGQSVTGATAEDLVFKAVKNTVLGNVAEPIQFNYTQHKNAGNISRTSICMKTIGKKNIGS